MRRCHFVLLLSIILLNRTAALGQTLPSKLTECEADHCDGVWTFNGFNGIGEWDKGVHASLSITSLSDKNIEIKRADVSGPTRGLTGLYRGQLQGNRFEGDVTWSWPGHWNGRPISAKWSATIVDVGVAASDSDSTASGQKRSTGSPPQNSHSITAACPDYYTLSTNGNGYDAWQKGKDLEDIEGDGVMGIGNFGHTREALGWYCKAAAAGSPNAPYEIGSIFEQGYVVNTVGRDGLVHTENIAGDMSVSFYWYGVAAERGSTKAMMKIARFYALGEGVYKGSGIQKDQDKAFSIVNKAAGQGDTEALLALAYIHSGVTPERGYAIFSPRFSSEKEKKAKDAARALFRENHQVCTDPNNLEIMKGLLPAMVSGRAIIDQNLVTVRVDQEFQCVLTVGTESAQDDESFLERLARTIRGGIMNRWAFSIVPIPNGDQAIFRRQTVTSNIVQSIYDASALMQSEKNSSQR